MNEEDEAWLRYTEQLKAVLERIPKDNHERREMHCVQCDYPLLVYLKWLHEEGNCLKWYCCQPIGAQPYQDWLDVCLGCGIKFGYPPPLKELPTAKQPLDDSTA